MSKLLSDRAAGLQCVAREFEAEIELLSDGRALREGAQFMLHAGTVCQAVQLLTTAMGRGSRRGRCRFRFMFRPEHVRRGAAVVFRDGGGVRGVGEVVVAGSPGGGPCRQPGGGRNPGEEDYAYA